MCVKMNDLVFSVFFVLLCMICVVMVVKVRVRVVVGRMRCVVLLKLVMGKSWKVRVKSRIRIRFSMNIG